MSSPTVPFLALITPVAMPPGGNPPGIWGGSNEGFPTHPIAPGGPPPGIWPGPGPLPHPEHPIAGPPPTIWPSPGHPEHPIVLPPDIGPPPGGQVGSPEHPINLPPADTSGAGFWHETFVPAVGWIWVWVPVPQPGGAPAHAKK